MERVCRDDNRLSAAWNRVMAEPLDCGRHNEGLRIVPSESNRE